MLDGVALSGGHGSPSTQVLKCTVGVAQLCCGASGGAASRIARLVLALPVGAYLLLRIVGVLPLNPTWDWIAFGAALLLLPCGVFEACGDAPQNRGEALTLACVPSAPCGNQSSRRGHRDNIASMA